MTGRSSVLWLCLLLWPPLATFTGAAELERMTDKPYKLQIVLHFAEHRVLTPFFKEQVSHEVSAQLRLALTNLAEVNVLSHHPKFTAGHAHELLAFDDWDELSDQQVHLVHVGFDSGRYQISTRLHDGMTGLNSPTTRRTEVSDRTQVAEQIVRLLHEGLGIVGTIAVADSGIELSLQAGARGVTLDPWVQPGTVFAVTRIVDDGGKARSVPITWAFLRVTSRPKQGICRAEYFHRYAEDALAPPAGALAGYRCLKLPEATTPLRLRFLDAESLQPLAGLQVHIGRNNFQHTERELSSDRTGLVESREAFANAAFVKVVSGGSVHANLPIALVDSRTIVCRLKLQPQAETLALLQYRRDEWLRRVLDAALVSSSRMTQLNTALSRSLETAQTYARASLEVLDRDLTSLETERRELKRQADAKQIARFDLGDGDERLAELRRRREELAGFLERLKSNIAEGKSEKTLSALKLLERARLLETEADYQQALTLYDLFLKENAGQTKIRDHVARLHAAWKARGPEHEKARMFIYQIWPTLDLAGLKSNLEKARQAFKTCREHGDALTPQRLLRANLVHVADLKRRLTTLQRQDGQEQRADAKLLAEVAEGLRGLHADVTAFLKNEGNP